MILGAFAFRNAAFDVYLTLAFGAFGYLLNCHGYSPAAVVMGRYPNAPKASVR